VLDRYLSTSVYYLSTEIWSRDSDYLIDPLQTTVVHE
jgi:hypothetical protein